MLQGILGTGSHGLPKPKRWSILEGAPVVIEIVDGGDRIVSFVNGPMAKVMAGGWLRSNGRTP